MVVMISCLGNHLMFMAVYELLSKKVSNIEKLNQSKEKLEETLRSRLGGVVVRISCVGKLVTQPPLVVQHIGGSVQHIIAIFAQYLICCCMAHLCTSPVYKVFF